MMADLYLLQDGTYTDETSKGDDGVLRGPNGLAVCLYADGSPQTLHRDAEANKNVDAANAGKSEEPSPAPAPAPVHAPEPVTVRATPSPVRAVREERPAPQGGKSE